MKLFLITMTVIVAIIVGFYIVGSSASVEIPTLSDCSEHERTTRDGNIYECIGGEWMYVGQDTNNKG